MSSLRRDLLTDDSVILAPGRDRRPNPYGDTPVDQCPFCPGYEEMTPPEVLSIGTPWRVRAFPNKFPLFDAPAVRSERSELTGSHEVVVESGDHEARFEHLSDDQLSAITAAWMARYAEHASHEKTVVVFKNCGPRAGASISHIHSQVVALPFVPPRLAHEVDAFRRSAHCPLCRPGKHLIASGVAFRWEIDDGARLAYGQRIIPIRHAPDFREMDEEERLELGTMLRSAASASAGLHIDASYNWGFHNFPTQSSAHWYVEVVPRVAGFAGFELTTGCYINSIDPGVAATELRKHIRT